MSSSSSSMWLSPSPVGGSSTTSSEWAPHPKPASTTRPSAGDISLPQAPKSSPRSRRAEDRRRTRRRSRAPPWRSPNPGRNRPRATLGRLDAAQPAEHPDPAEPDLDGQLLDRRIVGGDVGGHQPGSSAPGAGGHRVRGRRDGPVRSRAARPAPAGNGTGQQHDLADRRRRRLHRATVTHQAHRLARIRGGEPYVTATRPRRGCRDGHRPVPVPASSARPPGGLDRGSG